MLEVNLTAEVPAENSPIAQARQEISEQLGRLREMASLLEDRLAPILGPVRPADLAAEMSVVRGDTSHMAADLSDVASSVRESVDALTALARRVEL